MSFADGPLVSSRGIQTSNTAVEDNLGCQVLVMVFPCGGPVVSRRASVADLEPCTASGPASNSRLRKCGRWPDVCKVERLE